MNSTHYVVAILTKSLQNFSFILGIQFKCLNYFALGKSRLSIFSWLHAFK